jgi:hypothetical protein
MRNQFIDRYGRRTDGITVDVESQTVNGFPGRSLRWKVPLRTYDAFTFGDSTVKGGFSPSVNPHRTIAPMFDCQ